MLLCSAAPALQQATQPAPAQEEAFAAAAQAQVSPATEAQVSSTAHQAPPTASPGTKHGSCSGFAARRKCNTPLLQAPAATLRLAATEARGMLHGGKGASMHIHNGGAHRQRLLEVGRCSWSDQLLPPSLLPPPAPAGLLQARGPVHCEGQALLPPPALLPLPDPVRRVPLSRGCLAGGRRPQAR